MSFNFQTYKKVEPSIKTTSEELGAPQELTKELIEEHLKQLFSKNLHLEFSLDEDEMGIYLKKYVFGTYKIPKKKKHKKPVTVVKTVAKETPQKLSYRQLPKASMNMDQWKFTYSNADDKIAVMDQFWQAFDSQHQVIYKGSYKYNDELKVDFMVSNLVKGFLQEVDQIKNYLFGAIHILGSNEVGFQLEIVLMSLGQDLTVFKDNAYFGDYFSWIKLNPTNDQEQVNQFWCAQDTFEGNPIYETMIIK